MVCCTEKLGIKVLGVRITEVIEMGFKSGAGGRNRTDTVARTTGF